MTRLLDRDLVRGLVVLGWVPLGLGLDTPALGGGTVGRQLWIAAGTWALLLGLLRLEVPLVRAQVGVVVAYATIIELVFSGLLHTYVYRLDVPATLSVPMFVPPGHGLVYFGALCLGRSALFARHRRVLVAAVLVVGGTYATWGLFFSARSDVVGAFWFGCLVWFLFRGRAPLVYVGAFLVVTWLELVGTHLGTWTWGTTDPILHTLTLGNPPSGIAGAYSYLDAAGLALAPLVVRVFSRGDQGGPAGVVEPDDEVRERGGPGVIDVQGVGG